MKDHTILSYLSKTVKDATIYTINPGKPFKTSKALLAHGMAVCEACGKIQPRERQSCIECTEPYFWSRG